MAESPSSNKEPKEKQGVKTWAQAAKVKTKKKLLEQPPPAPSPVEAHRELQMRCSGHSFIQRCLPCLERVPCAGLLAILHARAGGVPGRK